MKSDATGAMLEINCPRCGCSMVLPLPVNLDKADAQRIARLILCDKCADLRGVHREPEPEPRARLPYADD
jgi:hypothetical protein